MKLNRVQRKVGKKTTSAQSGKTTENHTGETPKQTLILCLRSREADADIAQVAIPDDLASFFQSCVADANNKLGTLVIQALREYIIRAGLPPAVVDLEAAVQQTLFMLDSARVKLLEVGEIYLHSDSEFHNREKEMMISGYNHRLYDTAAMLQAAYETTMKHLQAGSKFA